MAGSRLEKFGSIYRRVSGLLRSGAVKYEDRPMWLDIYEAFPPKRDPVFTEIEPKEPIVRAILYEEDTVRARFYQVYGNPDVTDLSNRHTKNICQRFVDHYQYLQSMGSISEDDLFQSTTSDLKGLGIRLRTLTEVQKERALSQSSGARIQRSASSGSVSDPMTSRMSSAAVFGGIAREARDDEDWIEEPEDLNRRSPSDEADR